MRTLLLLTAALWPAFAQQAGPTIKVEVNVVNVLCVVRDKHGAYIRDLERGDFEIAEDGKPQTIRYFARDADLPMTVALMVDLSGSLRRLVVTEKDTAARFLAEVLRPQDKALLVGFSGRVGVWQDLTSSLERLKDALGRMQPLEAMSSSGPSSWGGGTLLYEAVYGTSGERLKKQTGRKAMVLITDGLDNGSRITLDTAVRAAQAIDAIIYGIYYVDSNSRFSERGTVALKKMSQATGGRMFRVGRRTPLSKIFEEIREEMRSQYALGFSPANPARDGTFRRLSVKTPRKGLSVQARQGYYATRE